MGESEYSSMGPLPCMHISGGGMATLNFGGDRRRRKTRGELWSALRSVRHSCEGGGVGKDLADEGSVCEVLTAGDKCNALISPGKGPS